MAHLLVYREVDRLDRANEHAVLAILRGPEADQACVIIGVFVDIRVLFIPQVIRDRCDLLLVVAIFKVDEVKSSKVA